MASSAVARRRRARGILARCQLVRARSLPWTDPWPTPLPFVDPERDLDAVREIADARSAMLLAEIGKRIVGQERVIDHLLIALFARGHCLFVGVPGLAKTLLIQTLADVLALSFGRIQFTPDLMPSDITGTDVLEEDRATGRRVFRFVRGPIFAQRHPGRRDQPHAAQDPGGAAAVDAGVPRLGGRPDLRRCRCRSWCSPRRTRSSRRAPIPLPEAQLDRFMFQIDVGYPVGGGGDPHRQPDDDGLPARAAQGAVARADPRAAGPGAARAGGAARRRSTRWRSAAPAGPTEPTAPEFVKKYVVLGRGAARLAVPGAGGQGARDPGRAATRRRSRTSARWRRRCWSTACCPTSTPRPTG